MIPSLAVVLPHQTERLAARALDQQLDALLAQLSAMSPGDPAASNLVRQVAELIAQLKMAGVSEADLHPAWQQLNKESLRLTNERKGPGWTPDR